MLLCKNFFHENFAQDQDTLIEQSILQIIQKISRKYYARNLIHQKLGKLRYT